MSQSHVFITPFDLDDLGAFVSLNMAWLEEHGLLEPADLKQLQHPERHVFGPGGEIFMAKIGATPVGCCAAIPRADGSVEIAKLAVDPQARRHGIGRRLVEAALGWGQRRHYTRALLTSNRRLAAALKLYESMGFRHAPMPADVPYVTADVYMELDLKAWTPSGRS